MNLHYVKSIIERTGNSAQSSDENVKKSVEEQIQNVTGKICSSLNVSSLDELKDSQEIDSDIARLVEVLNTSV